MRHEAFEIEGFLEMRGCGDEIGVAEGDGEGFRGERAEEGDLGGVLWRGVVG